MKLIADSGSTKTSWCVVIDDSMTFTINTAGINPVRDDEEAMCAVIREARSAIDSECTMGRAASLTGECGVTHIYFYGAGCLPAFTAPLLRQLEDAFPSAAIAVESDLLGAARALCGREEGVACILGTGANSCLYDGTRIVANVSPLGWILGDEGSGAVLGRMLVSDVLKGQLQKPLCEAFMQRFDLTQTAIIEAVYRQPQANRFLASLVPFLVEHRDHPDVHQFLVREFGRFFSRNVKAYGRADLPVNFVGGIAYQFEDELRAASLEQGFTVGLILRNPIQRLCAFHHDN